MDVTLMYFDDCPNWKVADGYLQVLAAEFDLRVHRQLVETPEEAERLQFRGSPSILLDGVDAFANADDPVGLACRRYLTPDGMSGTPTPEQLRDVLARRA